LFIGQRIEKSRYNYETIKDETVHEIRKGVFKYTNPLLDCEIAENSLLNKELNPFKDKVIEFIKKEKENGAFLDISVYFRDLNNGPWFGINENDMFSPASLLKVPLMMLYFKLAEKRI